MSERPPPSWGPASYDDRDLDAVLSGELAGLPEPLLPVAGALAALCAAPAPAELAGEAGARAMFREHAAALPAEQARLAAPAGGLLHRIPPARAADDLPRPRPHSHRRRRPPGRRLGGRRRWQAVALLGGGAAAAVAVAAVAGVFSGPGVQHVAAPGVAVTTAQAPAPASGDAPPPALNGGGSKVPSPSPTPSAGGQAGGQSDSGPALCREFFKLVTSTGFRGAARDDYQRLAKMADGQSVVSYCAGFGVGWGNPVYRFPSDRGWGPGGHGSRGRGGFGGGH